MLKPFHIVVDEFQSVTSLSTVEALSGIRKYKTSFTLCHQYTNQLSKEVMDAIKGNVGTKVVYRVGGDDAETLQRNLDVSEPKHLTGLADYEFYSQFKADHAVMTKYGYTLPMEWERFGHGAAICRTMKAKFAVPISEVEEKHDRWMATRHYGGTVNKPTVKKKNGVEKPQKTGSKSHGKFRSLNQIMLG